MEKIKEIFKVIQTKQIGVLVIIMMCFLALVMFSWLVGFWANGLMGAKFELGSCGWYDWRCSSGRKPVR